MKAHGSNQRKTGLIRNLKGLLLLPWLSLGCVYSIQPWHHAGSGGSAAGLLGVWREVDKGNTWVFSRQGDSLSVFFQEDKDLARFNGASFSSGAWTFLDLCPAEGSCGGGVAAWYLLPLHGLHRWELRQDTLFMSSLKVQALDSLLAGVNHPPLDRSSDRWVFTGNREEMAAFLDGHLLDESLFSEPTVLVKD